MPAVSPSATDCLSRASSASRPALVKPSVVGSATAACGQATSIAGAAAGAARRAACFAATAAVVIGSVPIASAMTESAASQRWVRR